MSLAELRDKMRNPLAGASEEDIAALLTKFSSTYVENCCLHEMNNMFIDTAFGRTISNLREQLCSFYGIGFAPYPKNGQNYAVIFENDPYNEKYWCHVSERIVNLWKEQAKSNGHA